MITFEQAIAEEKFVITGEISAPISAGSSELEDKIDLLKDSVHAINITDNPGATAHMASLAGCAIVRNKGIDPILQITCRDRNRLAIQSDLMGASALGINNVLTLGGDPIKNGETDEWQDWLVDDSLDQELVISQKQEYDDKKGLLDSAMKILNDREKEIIIARRLSENPKTLEKLSKKYKISRERVRQIETKAFEKLQKSMINASKSKNLLPVN